jgi:plastocyanin
MPALLAAALLAAAPVNGARGAGMSDVAAPTSPTRLEAAWEVQAGGHDAAGVAAHAFFPSPLAIHAGDSVTWRFAGMHSVTFPGGLPLPGTTLPGPEAGEETLGPLYSPMGPTGPEAAYDGAGIANSGMPLGAPPEEFGYRLTFTQAGSYPYICIFHDGMRGEIVVLPVGASLPETPAQAAARGREALDTLLDRGRDTVETIRSPRPASTGSAQAGQTGQTSPAVLAGWGDGSGASAHRFLPGNVTVRRGEAVVWTAPDPAAAHSVTFTSGAQPPDRVDLRLQPGGPPRLVLPANVVQPAGGVTYSGQGYAHSGRLRGGAVFRLRFDAPVGVYEYLCLFDPEMRGVVTVTE